MKMKRLPIWFTLFCVVLGITLLAVFVDGQQRNNERIEEEILPYIYAYVVFVSAASIYFRFFRKS